MAKSELDRKNRKAPYTNPSRMGDVRSGNPQLDPDAARKGKAYPDTTGDKPHAPPHTPKTEGET
jgi:hypothetical protein